MNGKGWLRRVHRPAAASNTSIFVSDGDVVEADTSELLPPTTAARVLTPDTLFGGRMAHAAPIRFSESWSQIKGPVSADNYGQNKIRVENGFL
jgi:hypothetical protein